MRYEVGVSESLAHCTSSSQSPRTVIALSNPFLIKQSMKQVQSEDKADDGVGHQGVSRMWKCSRIYKGCGEQQYCFVWCISMVLVFRVSP